MSSPESNQLTDHEYDGIREYDNPTPGWWHAIFAATVVFSLGYAIFWHASAFGWTVQDSWDDFQRAEFARVFGSVGELKHDEATILSMTSNQKFMTIAKATFIGGCAACHKRDGGGDVGVNLCDDSYKNVNRVEDIFRVITEGAGSGAMPSWKNRLSDNERVIVAAYVASLRGTTPAISKSPEGKVIPPWPSAPPAPPGNAPKAADKP
jgi:cytochrome c oxidase cbb3-type subunit 3